MERFKMYLLCEEKGQLTVEKYVRDVKRFLQWLGSKELNKEKTVEYKTQLVERYAVASANSMISSLNRYLEYIGRRDCRVKSIRQQRRMFLPEEKELTKAEYDRLIRAAGNNRRLCLLMQTICATGIRVSEHRFITVEAAKAGQAQIQMKGKHRVVFLEKRLCKALVQYAREQGICQGSIFVSSGGRPLDRSNIWAEMKKLCLAARVGREKVFPHNLRHLFARLYYGMQRDIARLADILGHSNINTTRIYTMESGQTHKKQLARLQQLLIT